jgi:hypothetical protein
MMTMMTMTTMKPAMMMTMIKQVVMSLPTDAGDDAR